MNAFAGHTPGPWVTDDLRKACGGIAIHGAGANDLALVEENDGADVVHPVEANAALIAAAPTLLAQRDALAKALREVAAIAGNMEGVTDQRDDMGRVARDALALLEEGK